MHTYLQVGSSFGFNCNPFNSCSSLFKLPSSSNNNNNPPAQVSPIPAREAENFGHSSSSTPKPLGTMEPQVASDVKSPVSLPDEKLEPEESSQAQELKFSTNLPTPPNDPCSLLQKEPDNADPASSSLEKGTGSILAALKGYLSPPRSTDPESQPQRHAAHPVSCISGDQVLASNFSNPSLPHYPPNVTSLFHAPLLDHEKQPALSPSCENLARLTGNLSDASRPKNTPPLTPRAMSNENTQSDRQPAATSSQPSNPSKQQTDGASKDADDISDRLDKAFPAEQSESSAPPVGSLKGKLIVRISEARGLRPAFDPYVICVFEWNEFVSNGSQSEEEAMERRRVEKELEPDGGRPMAIPMKSRQGSCNSLHDGLNNQKRSTVTDPHWNLEAAL